MKPVFVLYFLRFCKSIKMKKKKKKYHTFGKALKIQYEEKFEYTKRVIRSRKSKNDIEHNGQKDKLRSTKH